jgi:hypothetical protein
MPRIYNYWFILSLEAFVLVFWLLSISFLALPVGAAFYFVNGGQAGHYSRYDIGFVADPVIIAFIDLMMVSVAAGIIELCVFPPTVDTLQRRNITILIPSSILYFITLVTFSTIVHYHHLEHRHCACVRSETGHGDIESDSKAHSEKAQTEPEPLMFSGDEASPENGSLDLTTPESTTPEEVVYEEEQQQQHMGQKEDLIA